MNIIKWPVRVMHIVLSLRPGGRRTAILDLIKNMDKDKYLPFVCCLDELGCSEELVEGIQVKVMNRRQGWDYSLPFRLAKLMRREDVRLAHTHEATSLFYGTLAAKLAKVPVLLHTYHRSIDIDIHTSWDRIRNKIMFIMTDGITVASEANRQVVASAHHISPQRINLIYYGIDTDKYVMANVDILNKKKKTGLNSHCKIIGAVGHMNGPEKGFEYLIRAFAQVYQIEKNVELAIAGDGPLRSKLYNLSNELSIASRIHFLGFRTDMPELYQTFDLFVLPSIYEAFGLVLVEAMSAGKPVVATNVGGIPEIVQDGKTGIIVPPCNSNKLSEAIIELLNNQSKSASMGLLGQKRAEEKFGLKRMVEEYQNLYFDLLAKRTGHANMIPCKYQKKFRVMQLVLSLDIGGLEMLVVDLVKNLDRQKFEPIVCCLHTGSLADRITSDGIKLIHIEKKHNIDYGLILKLVKVLKQEYIDIIHSHNKAVHFYAVLAAKIAGIPIIHTKHGRNLPKGDINNIDNSVKTKLYRRISYLMTDLTVAVSYDAKRFALQTDGMPEEKIITIHNGIDTVKYNKTLSKDQIKEMKQFMGIAEHNLIIGNVARLSREKDHNTLLAAFAIVSNELRNVKLIIVGDGPLSEELQAKSIALNISSNVLFLGMRNDIPELLKLFDIAVLSSITEGIPLTLLEAMAAGLPIVATNVGGNPEVVEDQITGLLVPAKNPSALAEAMIHLLKNENKRIEMGEAGRKRVQKYFNLDLMVKQYEAIYETFLTVKTKGDMKL